MSSIMREAQHPFLRRFVDAAQRQGLPGSRGLEVVAEDVRGRPGETAAQRWEERFGVEDARLLAEVSPYAQDRVDMAARDDAREVLGVRWEVLLECGGCECYPAWSGVDRFAREGDTVSRRKARYALVDRLFAEPATMAVVVEDDALVCWLEQCASCGEGYSVRGSLEPCVS